MVRPATDNYRNIDIRRCMREGVQEPGDTCNRQSAQRGDITSWISVRAKYDRVIQSYRNRSRGGEWEDLAYAVAIVRTDCNLGGSRSLLITRHRGVVEGWRSFSARVYSSAGTALGSHIDVAENLEVTPPLDVRTGAVAN